MPFSLTSSWDLLVLDGPLERDASCLEMTVYWGSSSLPSPVLCVLSWWMKAWDTQSKTPWNSICCKKTVKKCLCLKSNLKSYTEFEVQCLKHSRICSQPVLWLLLWLSLIPLSSTKFSLPVNTFLSMEIRYWLRWAVEGTCANSTTKDITGNSVTKLLQVYTLSDAQPMNQ